MKLLETISTAIVEEHNLERELAYHHGDAPPEEKKAPSTEPESASFSDTSSGMPTSVLGTHCDVCWDCFHPDELNCCEECGQMHCAFCSKGEGELANYCDSHGPMIVIDGQVYQHFSVDNKNRTITLQGGEVFKYFPDKTYAEDEYADFLHKQASDSPHYIIDMVGRESLILWGLGQEDENGHSSIDSWIDDRSSYPEEFFGEESKLDNFSYDAKELFDVYYTEEIVLYCQEPD